MLSKPFLLEIGTEELPARFMEDALQNLRENAGGELRLARLDHGEIRVFGTPRRLALLVSGLAARQQDLREKKRGPALAAAFDRDGRPTGAGLGFARAQGVAVEELQAETIDGTAYAVAVRQVDGRPAAEILPDLCARIISLLTFPKPMFWYSKEVRFARPIRWLCALYGSDVVEFSYAGLRSGRNSYGHRFLAPGEIVLPSAEQYARELASRHVLVDQEERRQVIAGQVSRTAQQLEGVSAPDEELLTEVNYLVEYPKAVSGRFDPSFLEIPPEVLITVMRAHQRYFPVFDASGKLRPCFVAVSNGTRDEFLGNVRAGNERVLRARLADARFFFTEDRKKALEGYVRELDSLIFMEQLGSMADKTERIVRLTQALSSALRLPADTAQAAARAAALCKADLLTQMVYEFPELQGTMGRHYALLSGEQEAVAAAIGEHYAPRHAGDRLPESLPGAIVAIADKLDTLAGCFALGLIPSGSQDPYALRRSAMGVAAILLAHNLDLSLAGLARLAVDNLAGKSVRPADETAAGVREFLVQRVRHLLEEKGFRHDCIEAVLGGSNDSLPGLAARAATLQEKLDTQELQRILTPFTRAAGLVRDFAQQAPDPERFETEAERALYQASRAVAGVTSAYADAGDFSAVLAELASLQPVIDRFFSEVMVMVDDEALRNNRLSLLAQVRSAFLVLGDLSKIVQKK
jgi:glycyl-tRNA synthetase beta chain